MWQTWEWKLLKSPDGLRRLGYRKVGGDFYKFFYRRLYSSWLGGFMNFQSFKNKTLKIQLSWTFSEIELKEYWSIKFLGNIEV